MKTSSAKAKGRRLQDLIRDRLRFIGRRFGLEDDDVKSAIMGTSGVDIVLSPAARKIFNLDIEAKNKEALNVVTTFIEHYGKYAKTSAVKLLIHKKNRSDVLVTMTFEDFIKMFEENLQGKVPLQIVSEAPCL